MSRKDFHGGRSYSADPPAGASGPNFNLSLTLAWLKAQVARIFGLGVLASEAAESLSDNADQAGPETMSRMFQVIEGPGGSPASLGSRPADPMAPARRVELQDN